MKNKQVVCVIGAMECEVERLKKTVSNVEEIKAGKLVFYKGQVADKTVIIAKSGVGKAAGAVCTQMLIDRFKPDYIINTGVAGGLTHGLHIGDIVLAERLVQHDFDATVLGYAKGYTCNGINPKEPTYFYTDKNLADDFQKVLKSKLPELKIYKGTIASGDMFVADNGKKTEIKNLFNAAAVEMEAAAIAYTANLNETPLIIIRAVSDLADDDASDKITLTESDIADLSAKTVEAFLINEAGAAP